MASDYAMQKAAQAWCYPKTSRIVMDTDLAEAFADILDKELEEAEQLRVQLAGCLTAAEGGTSQEITAKKGQYGWSLAYQKVLELRRAYDGPA